MNGVPLDPVLSNARRPLDSAARGGAIRYTNPRPCHKEKGERGSQGSMLGTLEGALL